MSEKHNMLAIPKEGWEGFKENFSRDLTSGFVIFLLALPLSLGIASASEFPPIMGVVTAIMGGLVATFLTGSELSIKGPAAGLIVIVAGAVSEFGGGIEGWQLTLGVMVVAGVLQILFGVLKWGKFVDIFPLSAVHGMLAAIGLIIIAKQIPRLLNVDPELAVGKGPLELFGSIPEFITHLDPKVTIIGMVSLIIMVGWEFIKHPILKQIPSPLLVLLFAVPTGMVMDLDNSPGYTLVKVGKLIDQVGINVSLQGLSQISVFIKYVIMVALVGTLESLLTVKAIDLLDPWKRKANPNKDIIAIGVSNTLAAILGGIPMISEVARSSANVAQGGRTRWANFFHGLFLLVSSVGMYQVLEMIPNAALAAMLIAVGIKLTHPKEYVHTYKIGPEQLAIFVTTIFFTLFEDLLVGIASGMALKALIHLFRGASWKSLFRADIKVTEHPDSIRIKLGEAAVFTNYLGIKGTLEGLPRGKQVSIEIGETRLIDHSVMENLHQFKNVYNAGGGEVKFVGLESLEPASKHPLVARRKNFKGTLDSQADYISYDEKHLISQLKHYLPSQAALKDFVHHNSLHAFQRMEFFEAIFSASEIFGIKSTFNLNEYRKLYGQGRIDQGILERIIVRHMGSDQLDHWKQKLLEQRYRYEYQPRIGRLRVEWKKQIKFNLDDRMQPLLFRIISSYLDQGIAIKHFPFENTGLINAVRTLEQTSLVSFFKSKRVKNLLFNDNLDMGNLLTILVGDHSYFEQYVLDQQFGHKGWSGIISAIESDPNTLLYRKNICLSDFIKLELLMEIDVLDAHLGYHWKPIASMVNFPAQNYFAPVVLNELHQVLQLWQEAFEWDYYDQVLSGLSYIAKTPRVPSREKRTFQALFCVDDRECSLRRHIENLDPDSETFGTPGFYGVAIYFQAFGSKFLEKNCPVTITPKHLIKEVQTTKSRKQELFHHKHSHTFLRGLWFSLSLGFVASIRMVNDLFSPRMRADIADAFAHMDINGKLQVECKDQSRHEHGLQVGFTVEEMAEITETLLRGISLTENFCEVIYVIAHGSSSANNPHHGAHDCGACSGRPGGVNARVFAFMANHPRVRSILDTKGINIPESTQFLAAMHDTASDEIGYYDIDLLSTANKTRHNEYLNVIEKALDKNAKERARRFASIDINQDIKKIRKAIKARSVSYFEPRPELGHGTNALCYVGSREKMKGLFLDRRAFLQSYDYRSDLDGEVLAKVLGPLPGVCGGINLEYYFSRMDIEKMGAGTKLPHNVVGLIGVANSSDGDLRPGLPLQMVENHDPVRLLMIVEHHPKVVQKVITSSSSIYHWFDLGWIVLVAMSPESGALYVFRNGEFVPYRPLKNISTVSDFDDIIGKHPRMETNNILDATKENIPVKIIK